MDYTWTCKCCGRQQTGLPLDFAVPAPDPWFNAPEGERDPRHNRLDADLCVIESKEFYIRGCLQIPLIEHAAPFVWGVWVSVSQANFERVLALWDADASGQEPMFGWLSNNISTYPPTFGLKTNVHLRGGGLRPSIELEPTDHPLAREQRQGISLKRVEEIVSVCMRHD